MKALQYLTLITLLSSVCGFSQDNITTLNVDQDTYVTNYFLSNQASKYYLDSGNLSLKELNLSFSNKDKTVYVGKQFALTEEDEYENLVEIGARGKLNDDFSALFKNSELQNNIGLVLSYRLVYNKTLQLSNANDVLAMFSELNTLQLNANEVEKNRYLATLKADSRFAAEQIIESTEVDYIDRALMNWVTAQVYVPLENNEYNLLTEVTDVNTLTKSYYPFNASLGWTVFWQKSRNKSFIFSALGALKNTSNIETKDLNKFELQVFETQNPNLLKSSKTVYTGDFESFLSPSLILEAASFFISNQIGLSAQIEQNFGEYNATNWKLGIPFNLKSKVSRPNINFEIAWREINKDHFVGINVGFAFSEIIK